MRTWLCLSSICKFAVVNNSVWGWVQKVLNNMAAGGGNFSKHSLTPFCPLD